MNFLLKNRLLFSWFLAIIAMSGSLYFSEIRKFVPCDWCWYQRILMYPLVLLLGLAFFKKDEGIRIYILPLTITGIFLSSMHYLHQKFHIFGTICKSTVPCSGQYINWFGFVTIPFLALTAFILITLLLWPKKK